MAFTNTTPSLTEKEKDAQIEVVESCADAENREYLARYPLLANKTPEELKALNAKVLRKLDWRFLPCITAMLLMKYDLAEIQRGKC